MPLELKDATLDIQEEQDMAPQGCPYKLLRKKYLPLKSQEDKVAHNVSMVINQSCTSSLIINTLNCNYLPFGLLQAKMTQKDKTRMQEMLHV